jgi:hypothetical protein
LPIGATRSTWQRGTGRLLALDSATGYDAEAGAEAWRFWIVIVGDLEDFASVVRDGTRAVTGIPAYAHIVPDELVVLQHYIRYRYRAVTDLANAAR